MDDANLKNLAIDQAVLNPAFHRDVLAYQLTVASNIQQLNIAATTSDTGASFSIKSNTTGFADSGVLKLTEGENKIVIEVTSEDGTVKKYAITCSRLSSSHAALKNLNFYSICLSPSFESGHFDYKAAIESSITQTHFTCDIFDPNCAIQIEFNNVLVEKSAESNSYQIDLNNGFSIVQIQVTSPDKSNLQLYRVELKRGASPRLCVLSDGFLEKAYEDPVSLAPIYCACKVNEAVLSQPFLEFFQKTSPEDPLNQLSASDELQMDLSLESLVSKATVRVPLLNGSNLWFAVANDFIIWHNSILFKAFSSNVQLRQAASLVAELNEKDQFYAPEELKQYKTGEDLVNIEQLSTYKVFIVI